MSTNYTSHPPVFIKDAINEVGSSFSCYGTIVDITGPGGTGDSISNRPLQIVLDDGTGQLCAVYFKSDRADLQARLRIGDDLVAEGTIQLYRDAIQLKCEGLKMVSDPNLQSLWINQVIFYKTMKT